MLNYEYDLGFDAFESRLMEEFEGKKYTLVEYLGSFVNGIIGDLFIKMFVDSFTNDVDGAKEIAEQLNITEEDICILKGDFDKWSKLYYDMPTPELN